MTVSGWTRGPWSGISTGAEGRPLAFGDGKKECGCDLHQRTRA